ncbi:MAG: glycoside hydrolase family 127 protein [Clostridia bacterium]|nr:glycoside hydrolase family 127 protein [Clostridia bacterium]
MDKAKNRLEYAGEKKKFYDEVESCSKFLEERQLKDRFLWKRFADQFREQIDASNKGWRGEYWGKMMRGACLVWQYTKSEDLFEVITDAVKDMLTVAKEDGRVSSYERAKEFCGWDLWCRKYVILSLEYYLDICRDKELEKKIISFCSGALDYICERIGDGKIKITDTSTAWFGMNSASILEPVVKLYRITGKESYLALARHIIASGGSGVADIFALARENRVYPYQYGVSKAYEMISCFEGLLEYYLVTGEEQYKTSVLNFANAVVNSDLTVIGSCGCTHELFDHSTARQTAYYEGIMQETCVTVTWMKFCSRLLALTGDSSFADLMEQSWYNGYLGSLNTEGCTCGYIRDKFASKVPAGTLKDIFFPFDSYSPLRSRRRGDKPGGSQLLSDGSYYGCCVCIGSAGVGMYALSALMKDSDGYYLEFFGDADFEDDGVKISVRGNYPTNDSVSIKVSCASPRRFKLRVRIPGWSEGGTFFSPAPDLCVKGYAVYDRQWCGESVVFVRFDFSVREIKPVEWETDVLYTNLTAHDGIYSVEAENVVRDPDDSNFVSFAAGPLMLAAECSPDDVFTFARDSKGAVKSSSADPGNALLARRFTDKDGKDFILSDYAHLGRDWATPIAVWLRTAPAPKNE